jgi:arylsulfatase A-like enzyme
MPVAAGHAAPAAAAARVRRDDVAPRAVDNRAWSQRVERRRNVTIPHSGLPLPSRRETALAILAFWLAAALVAGLGHSLELLVARVAFDRLVWFSREFVWMSPVAYALVMLPGAVVLALAAMVIRRPWFVPVSAAAFMIVAVFGLLLPFSQVSRTASLILATGVGVAVARTVAASPVAWIRASRVAVIGGMVSLAAVAVAMPAWRTAREERSVSALPSAPESAPNVLVIILDTVRAASMGLYGSLAANTPRLEEWAKSGVVFDWAFSPGPWTLPSHASMFTGVWPDDQTGDWERPLDRTHRTLAELFQQRGYRTAGFVANMHYTAWDSGLDRGFHHYEGYLPGWGQLVLSSSYTQTEMFERLGEARDFGDIRDAVLHPNLSISPKHRFSMRRGDQLAQRFLDWQAASTGHPFFAFLNLFDGHQPYYAPPPFRRFTAERPGEAAYLAAIAFLDHQVDSMLTVLQDRGILDNTIVVVTSDHGELFGENGLSGHAHNLYLNVLRVPLYIRFPAGVPRDLRLARPVSLRDMAATIAGLAGAGGAMPGHSLANAWTGDGPTSPAFATVTHAPNVDPGLPTSRGGLQSLLDSQWQLIRNDDGTEELFDYVADSLQERNLATFVDQAGRMEAMRSVIRQLLAEQPSRTSATGLAGRRPGRR